MGFLSLTFRDLQYIVALADHKHFGNAAKACYVSQPALSAQIKKIEGYFGKTLFERQNKSIRITNEGKLIVEKSRELLENAHALDLSLQKSHDVFDSPFIVGLIHTLSPYLPKYFIPTLLQKFPHCSCNLVEGFTHELLVDLKAGKIDALLASEVFQDEKLDSYQIFKEPLCLIINKKHPLAKNKSVSIADLNTEEMFFLKEGNCLRNEAINLCPKNKRGNINEAHLSSLAALKYMVALHPIYAIIPHMAASLDDDLKQFVVVKPFQEKEAYRQISLFVRKNTLKKQDIQAFLEVFTSESV